MPLRSTYKQYCQKFWREPCRLFLESIIGRKIIFSRIQQRKGKKNSVNQLATWPMGSQTKAASFPMDFCLLSLVICFPALHQQPSLLVFQDLAGRATCMARPALQASERCQRVLAMAAGPACFIFPTAWYLPLLMSLVCTGFLRVCRSWRHLCPSVRFS